MLPSADKNVFFPHPILLCFFFFFFTALHLSQSMPTNLNIYSTNIHFYSHLNAFIALPHLPWEQLGCLLAVPPPFASDGGVSLLLLLGSW